MQGFVVRLPASGTKRNKMASCPSALPPSKRLQSCLNFGQKQLQPNKVCSLCGMIYSESCENDIKSHNKMCLKV